jgi:hypothetical protein
MISDKEIRRVKKLVRKYLKYWVHILGLGFWRVDLCFIDCFEDRQVVAETTVEWKYLEIHITFSLVALCDFAEQRIERIVLHELCHGLINEMRSYHDDHDHEERVASQLANAFMWVKEE